MTNKFNIPNPQIRKRIKTQTKKEKNNQNSENPFLSKFQRSEILTLGQLGFLHPRQRRRSVRLILANSLSKIQSFLSSENRSSFLGLRIFSQPCTDQEGKFLFLHTLISVCFSRFPSCSFAMTQIDRVWFQLFLGLLMLLHCFFLMLYMYICICVYKNFEFEFVWLGINERSVCCVVLDCLLLFQ